MNATVLLTRPPMSPLLRRASGSAADTPRRRHFARARILRQLTGPDSVRFPHAPRKPR